MSEYIVKLDGPYAAGYHVGEEIVRCKDCKHFTDWDGFNEFPTCIYHGIAVKFDGFCAWAERRQT